MIFPEGHRTRNGEIQPPMPGIHLLIKRSLAPIVPVGIAGAYQAWPHGQSLPRPAPLFCPAGPGTVAASIGPPLDTRRLAELPREQVLQEIFDILKTQHARAERLRRRPSI